MKKFFTILMLCFVVQLASGQGPQPELLYYDFNGTGTSVSNLASTPPAGTTTATISGSLSQSGSVACYGGALIGAGGNGGTDDVSTGWVTSLPGDWTISFIYGNLSTPIFSYLFGDNTAGSFRCFTNGAAGADNTILRGPINDVIITGGAAPGIHVNTWVYDGTAGEIRGYLDGVLNVTVAQTPPTISGTGPFLVGAYSTSAGLTTGATMDEFRVYSRALSPAEVMELTTFFDVTTNTVAQTITANFAGQTYRWLDCGNGNAVIAGETNQAYTATANGSYAVEITSNGCVDTSACVVITGVGIEENTSLVNVGISPNPTNGLVNVKLNNNTQTINYTVSTIEGKTVRQEQNITANNFSIDLTNQSKGIYLLKLDDNTSSKVYKIIKQ